MRRIALALGSVVAAGTLALAVPGSALAAEGVLVVPRVGLRRRAHRGRRLPGLHDLGVRRERIHPLKGDRTGGRG
ncbi:hypothetical protein GCM10010245_62200 [Streptomyces spectabilis]|uniref:Uncharacterized protein n=1 Tax=Streptomyces spectabilis TaxID=68270 RepID=A0A7W8B2U4_STRST|nr:hypothetical protein [Streptomyces spectabilis]GGV39258.1 hypothetical protein GCM10010245_62200 [Streptomyces spectabilis]